MSPLEVLLLLITTILGYELYRAKKDSKALFNSSVENRQLTQTSRELQSGLIEAQDLLGMEREKNRQLLSQKKSSETRLGQISEHLVPFLEKCQHDPKNMHFLGNPIDYVVFDFDQGAITFLEVKSGNSKASKRQKTVKNIIKSGRVYYEEIRINEKGVRNRVVMPNGLPPIADASANITFDDGMDDE